ncbi:hypothetical protein [Deinococcus hopiensis]|uniref:Uncharacterized protein n=1 Tax=Deinococcus hopiensis KR-140 TaxID=695939 RepID=A0A1W1V7C9_9DEIO|nr:hypothetical protein [Deinococcus hopiensis]SMB89176.1 hypothetical protein SAMN00790413_00294 [Deinococcus hopiensis KR-140]
MRTRPTNWRTLRTPDGTRGPREQQREARTYAEAWLQAIRDWDTVTRSDLVLPSHSGGSGSRLRPVGLGMSSNGSMVGFVTYTRVRTPMGDVSASALGSAITAMADIRLDRTRAGTGLASLIDERGGWASPKDRALDYAVAVLTLATRLGDTKAENYLSQLQKSGD